MGISNYTNLSELMNERLQAGPASISELVEEGLGKKLILASEGEMADRSDLENGFIALTDALYRAGAIKPVLADETETLLFKRYESGELAANGYGGPDGDQFLKIKWAPLAKSLPIITNINL